MYRHMNEQLHAELDIIKWHIKFLQDGRNAKQILEDYEEVVKQNRKVNKKLEDIKEEYEILLKEQKIKVADCLKKLSSQ